MRTRTWVVTGCSTGFGRVLARTLLERGERVVVTARKRESLTDLIERHKGRILALNLDVTRESDIDAAVRTAIENFGSIDVLVNNAGFGAVGTVEETPMETARAMMETNFFGTLAMIRAVLPCMIGAGSGQIVNVGSVAGQVGFPLLAYYSASKFALAGLSESLAAELRPLGISVTLAELGPFATNFSRSMTINPPAGHYDPSALSLIAGNAGWGAGHDPQLGAEALLTALDSAVPPVRIILGARGLEVTSLHDARRAAERERWLSVSQLAKPAG